MKYEYFILPVLALFIGCATSGSIVKLENSPLGKSVHVINSGSEGPGQVIKGIVIFDESGQVVSQAYFADPKLGDKIIGGLANVPAYWGSAAIGGYLYKEAANKYRPDQSNINVSGGNASASAGASAKSSSKICQKRYYKKGH